MSHLCGFLYSHTPPKHLKEIGCWWVAIKPQINHVTSHFFAERLQRKRERGNLCKKRNDGYRSYMADGHLGPHEVVCNK